MLCVFVTLGFMTKAIFSQSSSAEEWKTLNEKIYFHYQQGQHEQAIELSKRALKIAEQTLNPDHPVVAESRTPFAAIAYYL